METSRKTRTRRRRTVERMSNLAIAYLRVSTTDQAQFGAGLDAQRTAIEAFAATRGMTIAAWHVDEGVSGSVDPENRPELSKALEALSTGPAGVLLFLRIDRVGRVVYDLLGLAKRAEREGWTLAAADGSVDLTTPAGRTMFTVQGAFAELEREMIRQRTREGLAEKRAQGVRLGRPSVLPAHVVEQIVTAKDAGKGWTAIARDLMAAGIPTARGGATWHASAVQKVYQGQDAAKLAEAA
jgi:DNA invertase Pin-like site-specific DNA recombinase